jgi:hypothetical protein
MGYNILNQFITHLVFNFYPVALPFCLETGDVVMSTGLTADGQVHVYPICFKQGAAIIMHQVQVHY